MAVAEKNRLKKWIYQTNDLDLLVQYYDKTADLRNDTETDRLERRIASALALDTMISRLKADRETMILDAQVFGVRRSGNRIELMGVLPDVETGGYGDDPLAAGWHQLFRGRGIEISTEDLSMFAMEGYPLYVMRELVDKVLPKTQVVTQKLLSYDNLPDEENRVTERSEYNGQLAEKIRGIVWGAVEKWRSPVLITVGDITLTVIGVDEDDLLYVEEGFAGIESQLSEIDTEALIDDGANGLGNVSIVYLADREAVE